jgi:hypothetical protein
MRFYKHMSNMRHDPRIKRLISRYGIEGYGLYNVILETIAERIDDQRPLPILQENCEDLADFYNGNTSRFNEIVSFMVNQGLFEVEEIEGKILCSKIYKFLESSQTRSEEIRRLIKSYKNASEPTMIDENILSETVSDICEEETRQDKTRQEESKHSKSKIKLQDCDTVPVNDTTHQQLIQEYGEATILDYYQRINDYVASKGNKKYKDYASTARNWIKSDIDKGKGPKKQGVKKQDIICPVCSTKMGATGCYKCHLPIQDIDDQESIEFHRQRLEQ